MRRNPSSSGIRDRYGRTLSLETLEGRAVPAVLALPATVSVKEGESRQVSFKLNTAPTANVTFTLQCNNTAEAAIDKQSLTFTPANWRTPQVVAVSAVEDMVKDGNKSLKIVTSVSSSTDPKYANKSVPDVTVNTIDSKKVPPIDSALYQGSYSGNFTGARARGPITATVDGRTISVQIRITAPAARLVDVPAFGSGTIADDGSFSFQAQGTIFGAVYKGKISIGQNGQVSASGTWKFQSIASGTWRVDRLS